ncbi:MAG: hypothetical protein A2268_03195 [Candidatus Raymondbacteria bacterium RifOxyA12_full_50_37]|uniref:Hydrolase TatD n=1 Tax=Candidatus Raymondbacteria bacterium RIFOXYD12_FULL_49_13 TaxID=1817890 RepID=A0A1F7F8D0_UNCRA|nr:MAG: hypothetical protein A2268_03195 [Candidatus Raymondbacteria bacterium RifOxyA12_full_50_37]OGJ86745.1 MAG: hypothetical protein A2248_09925 [Candidatus Raymondbacteria bacterium RIFOXYA2_FULL_49_16]OGK01550.1 MAG: hypothetical protein A2350_06465 [Candidatus Raymondbacteria bacterium RifOxyB12_full_50_8]OGK02838.1 MAG: hypothetical protein A2519_06635 [Candidatus Raymondbacteria bacterium RIFOXYD12_FULL_49_13]OGP40922.1 MAG: hypothetical protein A2324_13355 [Candidatus Raymondbacteria 
MSVDSHSHLFYPEFNDDLPIVIERAAAVGIKMIICSGTDLQTSRQSIELACTFPMVHATIGIHPHEASKAKETDLQAIDALCDREKVVAIGEAGLDFHYDSTDRKTQEKVFSTLLSLARRRNLPIVVHSREAESEALQMLRDHGIRNALFHCFTGTAAIARKIIDAGYHIGVTGIITFKGATVLAETICTLPLDRLLPETDCPYLAPIPFRGKRNEPCHIPLIIKKIAQLFPGNTEKDIENLFINNLQQIFPLVSTGNFDFTGK